MEVCPVRSQALREALVGQRVVFLSDLHSWGFSSLEKDVLEIVAGCNPTLILLGGDYVKAKAARVAIREVYHRFAGIAPTWGVLGNNDYEYGHGLKALVKGLNDAGVRLLRNQSLLWPSHRPRFAIAGVEDAIEGKPDMALACKDIPDGVPCILVSHTPQIQHQPVPSSVRLVLAGHTHGGQIRIPILLPVFLFLKGYPLQRSGMSQGMKHDLYVTRGVGTTGPAWRFRCSPEVVLLSCDGQDPGVNIH